MNEIDTLKNPAVGMLVGTVYGTAIIKGVYPNGRKRTGWVYLRYHKGEGTNKPHRLPLSRSQEGFWYLENVKQISFSERDDYRDIVAEKNRCFEEDQRFEKYSLDLIDQVTERLKEIGDDEITEIVLNLLNKIN